MSILAQLRKLSAESVISAPKTDVCIVDFDHEIKAYSQHLRYAKNTWDLCRKNHLQRSKLHPKCRQSDL